MTDENFEYLADLLNAASTQREVAFDQMKKYERENKRLEQGNRHLRTMNDALTKEINALRLESASRRASRAEPVTPTQPEAGPMIETAQEVHEDIESPTTPSDTSEEPDSSNEVIVEADETPKMYLHLGFFLWNIDLSVAIERSRQ